MSTAVTTTGAKPPLRAGGAIAAIVPQNIEEAFRLASAIVASGMAPKSVNTPEKAMVAILAGLEIGLTPMAALQSIAVVNGFPTIWGDGALGLVRGSGLCEGVREWIDGDGDAAVAYCEVKRKGEAEPILRSFSVAQAKKANLLNKQGPWTDYRARMLQMRARSYALRDGFADVLRGLRIREEVDDYHVVEEAPAPGIRARLAAAKSTPAEEGFTVAHSATDKADAALVGTDTGEVLDAAHEAASEAESDSGGLADEFDDGDFTEPGPIRPVVDPNTPEGVLADFKALLDEATTAAEIDAAKAAMAPRLNDGTVMDGGSKAKARDLLADARQRVAG